MDLYCRNRPLLGKLGSFGERVLIKTHTGELEGIPKQAWLFSFGFNFLTPEQTKSHSPNFIDI